MQKLLRWAQVPRNHNGPVCANTFTPITTYFALQYKDMNGDWVTIGTDTEDNKDTEKNALSTNIESIIREALPNAEIIGRSTTKLFPMLFVKDKEKHYKVSIVIQRADENKFED